MSQEGEKINLRGLKMDEALNLCGRKAHRSRCIVDGIVGECQVTSGSACVDAPSSASLCACVGTGESCCTASSISCPLLTSIHISAPPPPSSPPSPCFCSVARSGASPRQPAAEQEVGGGLVRSGRPVSVAQARHVTGWALICTGGHVRGRWRGRPLCRLHGTRGWDVGGGYVKHPAHALWRKHTGSWCTSWVRWT